MRSASFLIRHRLLAIPLLLAALGLVTATPARALPAPLTGADFAPIKPSGITVALNPLFTIPADAGAAPLARIQYVTSLADGRMFTNNVNGSLFVNTVGSAPAPYLQLQNQNVGATVGPDPNGPGFMGVAFHPNFAGDPNKAGYGQLYTETYVGSSTAPLIGGGDPAHVVEVREWTTATPNAASFSGTSRVVTAISTQGGGTIAFNPTAPPNSADYGNLYIGVGDATFNDADHAAQNLGVAQGKMLRINPMQSGTKPYTIPAGNPFTTTTGVLPEIWAYGLRYPQSFGWDSVTGTMYINDLGQAGLEEVDIGKAGANYGWSQREGTVATGYAYGQSADDQNIYPLPPGSSNGLYTDPIAQWAHSEGYALGSGFLYRGTAIPELFGLYVMQDIVTGRIFVFDPTQASGTSVAPVYELGVTQDGQLINLRSTFGYDSWLNGPRIDARLSLGPNGELLDAFKATGTVYALSDTTAVPEPASFALLLTAVAAAHRLNRRRTPRINPA